MKLFARPLLLIAITALAFFVVNESFRYFIGLEKAKREYYEKDKLILNNLTAAQAKNLQILAETLSLSKAVIKGYRENNPEIVKGHIGPIWEKVKDEKLTYEIHFFKPPAVSFVNFSNFKSIGKDVASVRTDIEWITSSFKSSTHALMCKTYAGYRATHPIIDSDGTMLGGLSLGKKIDWIPKTLKEKTKHDSFLVYTKKSTNSLMSKYYANFIKDKEIVGDYILANKTLPISTDNIKKIDFTKKIQTLTINDLPYTLYTYPIIDFNKQTMGYILTLTTLEEFKESFNAHLLKNFVLIFLTSLIIFLITRKRTQNLLNEMKHIKNITKKIQSREFSTLHKENARSHTSIDTLVVLEHNIIEMGLELEKHYDVLESENRDKTEQIIKQLYTDELTGLSNRNALFREVQNNPHAFIAIFNIRNFKEINDAFGFETGNYILKGLAAKYAPYSKEKGYMAFRVGSDEFALISSDKNISTSEFENFVVTMLDKIEHTLFNLENENITISVDMYAGICFDRDKKLEKADMALSLAKKHRKEFVVYSQEKNTKDTHFNNIEIINRVSNALKNNDIIVYYQPIVDKSESINKYEALVRMRDGDEIISPYFFLDISKRTKHYSSISKVVIEKTFAKFRELDKAFSINITADDILNEDVYALIKTKMQNCKAPSKVVFELVESDDLYNLPEIEEFINMIKEMGAQIAIDDFGTGYSNFSYMMKIKPNYLKIDGSLIKNIDSDINAHKIVKTVVLFANELGIKTIAEFVHSKEIFEACKELRIDEFQGFYFSEPKEEL
ncbi:MAG: bifunctional diguanylate cyclase/phosphodiesterase [Campylobacterota bacterium]